MAGKSGLLMQNVSFTLYYKAQVFLNFRSSFTRSLSNRVVQLDFDHYTHSCRHRVT